MKKILALILATFMMMTLFVACGEEKASPAKTEKEQTVEVVSDEDLIKGVIDKYAAAAVNFDTEALAECVAEDSDLYEEIKSSVSTDTMKEQISQVAASVAESIGGGADVVSVIEDGMGAIIDACVDSIEINYEDITVNDDKATVNATILMMDPEKSLGKFAGGDFESYIDDDFKKMSQEEFKANMADVLKNVFENLIDEIEGVDFEKAETDAVLELVKIDGEWLITADE